MHREWSSGQQLTPGHSLVQDSLVDTIDTGTEGDEVSALAKRERGVVVGGTPRCV